MQVILLERVENLGQMGEIVRVRAGYARNYLIPQKKAAPATEENQKRFEVQRAQLEARNLERRQEAEAVAEQTRRLERNLDPSGWRQRSALWLGERRRHRRRRYRLWVLRRAQPDPAQPADQGAGPAYGLRQPASGGAVVVRVNVARTVGRGGNTGPRRRCFGAGRRDRRLCRRRGVDARLWLRRRG